MLEERESRKRQKTLVKNIGVSILIVLSLMLNGVFIFNYIETSKKLNIMWSNAFGEFAKVLNWGIIHPDNLNRIDENTLMMTKQNIQALHVVLDNLMILPEGQEIIPFTTVQKIGSLTNYEYRVIALLEEELKSEGQFSEENLERFSKINTTWQKMLDTLSSGENQVNPFNPIFLKERWKEVWSDSIRAMEEIELIPLP